MNNSKTILIAILAVLAVACTQQSKQDYTLFSGQIENNSAESFTLVSSDQTKTAVKVADDGTIADTLRIKEGKYVLVYEKDYVQIYLAHGTRLNIVADAKDFSNSLVVEGEMAGLCNYLNFKSEMKYNEQRNSKQLYSIEETAFMDTAKQKRIALDLELDKVEVMPDSLRSLEVRDNKMGYLLLLNNYPSHHGYFTQKKNDQASEELKAAMADYDYSDGELYKYSSAYRAILGGDSYKKSRILLKEGKASSNDIAALLVANEVENEIIREEMLFSAASSNFSRTQNLDKLFTTYKQYAKDEAHIKTITEKYNQLSKLNPGNPSPKFVDYENYAGGTSSLDDFKGKYVYIDVWATWCGPCKAEIPHLQKVEEKYHGKNIVFVSISVDVESKKEAWKNMIGEKNMGGVQLIASNNKFMEDYSISGIPRFILIDPQGNIVNKNAPRPSDPKLVALFNELGI